MGYMHRAIDGEEIAQLLGVSRQRISMILKAAMRKMYKNTQEHNPTLSPHEITLVLMSALKVDRGSCEDVKSFYELFPTDIKNIVKNDVEKKFNLCN